MTSPRMPRRDPGDSISGKRVAREMTAIIEQSCEPDAIVSNNSTEFTCKAMLA